MYTPAQRQKFMDSHASLLLALQELSLKHLMEAEPFSHDSGVREQLLHGAARRLGVLCRSLVRIFELFPLDQERPLSMDTLADVQINLHAFVINLSGIFDNWAWAYVVRHDLLGKIGGLHSVGLFNSATRSRLPLALREYLGTQSLHDWQTKYLKNYRDALAHRIPLYIPPAEFTAEEGVRFNELEAEKQRCMRELNWPRINAIHAEQSDLGVPSFTFQHSFAADQPSRAVLMHPQLLTDGHGVVEFGKLFLEHWQEVA